MFISPRPWADEGVAHFAQALWREHASGRQAALDYMGLHRTALADAEKLSTSSNTAGKVKSLINSADEEFYRSKAMFVWWMLRDMIGDAALKRVLAAYNPEDDKNAPYIERLVAAESKRDLSWFFEDWVYNDRGLPDLRVVSAYPRALGSGSFMTTVTVENLRNAGAEVPVTVNMQDGEVTKRLQVGRNASASIRIETPSAPLDIVVNDGSVPESDMANNSFRLQPK
jgi:aminopeptidase N